MTVPDPPVEDVEGDGLRQRIESVRRAVAGARRSNGAEPFPGAGDLPTMLAADEVDLLFRLAKDTLQGWGEIVELGTFLGGSTLALGQGLLARTHPTQTAPTQTAPTQTAPTQTAPAQTAPAPRIHTYDLFIQQEWPDFNVGAGENVLPRWEETVAAVRAWVEVYPGPLQAIQAPPGPIELLFIDIVKQPDTMTEVMHGFVSKVIPGSIIVHQDMFHWGSPWVLATVEALWDRLTYVGHAARSSGIFVVNEPIADLAAALDWGAISPSAQLSLIDDLALRFEHPTLRGTIELAGLFLAKLTDPAMYERRLKLARYYAVGPRLERFLEEVQAADSLGALQPGHHERSTTKTLG